jgi:aspartyl protease family protein
MDDGAHVLYALICIMLVGSALLARRLPLGDMVKMALIWVALFGAVALLAPFIAPYLT